MKGGKLVMKCRRPMFVGAVLALVCSLAVGLAATVGAASKTTITIWHYWPGVDGKEFEDHVAIFNKENTDVEVKPVFVPQEGYDQKVLSAIAGNVAPDIILANVWNAASYMSSGQFRDMGPLLRSAKVSTADFLPWALEGGTYKGKIYGLPSSCYWNVIFYNKDLVREAGLDPNKFPTTMDELDQWAEKLTKINADGKIERMGFVPWLGDWPVYVYAFGGDFVDPKGKVLINSPQVARMYAWWLKYATKYDYKRLRSFTDSMGNLWGTTADSVFYTGKLAIMLMGPWQVAFAKEYAPKLDYGLAPVPAPKGGVYGAYFGQSHYNMITKNCKNPAAAMKWIKFWTTDPRALTRGNFPATKSGLEAMAKSTADPKMAEFARVGLAGKGFNPPPHPAFNFITNNINNTTDEILFGRKTIEQALEELEKLTLAEAKRNNW